MRAQVVWYRYATGCSLLYDCHRQSLIFRIRCAEHHARYRYLSAVAKPSPLGKVAERKRGRMRISHFAEMRVDIEHCTALIRLAFGDPPSPKGKALVRQITIFITVMVEGPKGCYGIDRVRNALAAGPARQIPV